MRRSSAPPSKSPAGSWRPALARRGRGYPAASADSNRRRINGLIDAQIHRSAACGHGCFRIGLVRTVEGPKHAQTTAHGGYSSAKDQLTGQAVAVKKIMKPFSTPVLSKRTYRELKLLKHLKHENVRRTRPSAVQGAVPLTHGRSSPSATSSFLLSRICTSVSALRLQTWLILFSQLFCDRIARNRSAPTPHLETA